MVKEPSGVKIVSHIHFWFAIMLQNQRRADMLCDNFDNYSWIMSKGERDGRGGSYNIIFV